MILGIVFGMFLRSVMTIEVYEWILTLICVLSLTSSGFAILEEIILSIVNNQYSTHRISSVFFYPNYFGTIASTVIIICAYKLLTEQGQKWLYYFTAFMNVISLYLCKSMFAFVEVFVGIAVLLIIFKKYKLFACWLSAAALAGFMIFILNLKIIPRLDDATVTFGLRLQIWRMAQNQILKTPLFGHGFMTFTDVYDSYYNNQIIPHSHSLYLDMILNFGIIGTILFLWYFVKYYTAVAITCLKDKKPVITSLILAVTAAALVHGIIDLTLLWIQTLPLFLFVLSGFGGIEKVSLNERRKFLL
jgi:O-antigen ligase